jgi:probable rRNA maturation factor
MFHLLGYDHIKEDEKKIMRAKEKRVIEKLQLFR